MFIETALLLRERLKGRMLVLVGSPTHAFGSYEEIAMSLGLVGRVHRPGRLPMADLRLLCSYADHFVFPSLYEEFGVPVLEAIACVAPVIPFKIAALGEMAGDAALLVDPADALELGYRW